MNVGLNEIFILSTMFENENDVVSFEEDDILHSLTDCVDRVSESLKERISNTFKDGIPEDVFIPSKEDIYNSLYSDKHLCYIICDGGEEKKIVYHVSKISIENNVNRMAMSFCQN